MSYYFSRYSTFYKNAVELNDLAAGKHSWDILLSAYNQTERVERVFNACVAKQRIWLICPEYMFTDAELPKGDIFVSKAAREDEYVLELVKSVDLVGKSIALDITGFMRPTLMFLIAWLKRSGVVSVDCLYSEPVMYSKGADTMFSNETITEVRQVAGFEGSHIPDSDDDLMIIGCGYDNKMLEYSLNHKARARKIQLFPFPSLRPQMYQENRYRTALSADAIGAKIDGIYFAPAHDPFINAEVLGEIVEERCKPATNLYLCPLATKPQILGFVLYYLSELVGTPASIVFPFYQAYSKKTSDGVSKIWVYQVELT